MESDKQRGIAYGFVSKDVGGVVILETQIVKKGCASSLSWHTLIIHLNSPTQRSFSFYMRSVGTDGLVGFRSLCAW